MVPGKLDLTIYRGDTYKLPLRLRERNTNGTAGAPLDLTGCTIKAQARTDEDGSTPLASFTVTPDADPTTGLFTLSLTVVQTKALRGGVWDVEVTWPDGTVSTYLKGKVTVLKDVTRT